VFKLLQIVKKLVQYLSKQGTLAHSGLSKEKVDLFPQSRVVFIKVEKHDFDLVIIESEHFVESLNAVKCRDTHLINLVVQHVDQKVETFGADITAHLTEAAHSFDSCQANSHGVIFKHE